MEIITVVHYFKTCVAGLKNNSDPIRKNLMEFVSSSKLDMESSAGIKNSQKNNKIIFKPNDGGRDAEIRLLKIVANEKIADAQISANEKMACAMQNFISLVQ